jgi:hypothetical protein
MTEESSRILVCLTRSATLPPRIGSFPARRKAFLIRNAEILPRSESREARTPESPSRREAILVRRQAILGGIGDAPLPLYSTTWLITNRFVAWLVS